MVKSPIIPNSIFLTMSLFFVSFSNCLGVPVYTAAWAQPEVFTEIIVSPKMVSDHLPDAVFRALTQLNEKNFRLRESIRLRTRTVPLDEALIEIE